MIRFSVKILIVLISIGLLFSACQRNDKNEVNTYIDSARTFMAQNKPASAAIEYRNAIQLDPDNETALFELAETYVLLQQINQASRYYGLAAKASPGNITPLLRLAQINLQTGNLLDARSYISRALELSPTSINAYHILSGIQIKERDLESAIETLNKAISLDPNNIKTFLSLAQLYVSTKSFDKAENAYRKAMALDMSSREAYMGLAKLFSFQKRWNDIEVLLKEVLSTDGIKAEKYSDLATFYFGQKRYGLAEENYQKAALENKDEIKFTINLAEFYTKRNMRDKAILTMQNALAKQKNNPLTLTGLSQIYLHFKMIDMADEYVDKALSIKKDFVDAISQKGRVLMARNEFKLALDKFDEVLALDRINAKAYYYRALCIKNSGATGRPEQEVFRAASGMLDNPEEFEKEQIKGNLLAAIAVDPDMIDARSELAQIYMLERKIKKAKEQINEVIKRASPDMKTMTLLSGIHLLEGNVKAAEDVLKVIIRENPNYLPAQIRLGFLYNTTDRKEEAINHFNHILADNPKQVGIAKILVEIYASDKRYDDALNLIKKTITDKNKQTKAFLENLKGEINLKKGDLDTALENFTSAKQLKPDYVKPYMHIAGLLNQDNQPDRALLEYETVERINPLYIPALIAMGYIYDAQGNQIKAEEYYRKVLEIDPKHPAASNNLAFILSEKPEHLEEAFRLAKIAREKAPNDPNVIDTMGWVFYQKGNYLNALSELEESLALYPNSALAKFHYGMTLYQTKDYEKARKLLKEALEIDPDFKGAVIARKILY